MHLIESNSKEVHGVAREGLPALRDGEAVLGGAAAAAHQGGLVENKFIKKNQGRRAEEGRAGEAGGGQGWSGQ